jgi:response regulator RpfG family c-di-GMP phosphodiesterase
MSVNYGSRFETMESAFVSNEDASLFVQLAQAYRDAGDYDRALRILRRGIEQHPGYGPGYEILGRTLLDRGRVAESAFCFERLLEIDPSNPIARAALDEIARRLREAPIARPAERVSPAPGAAPLPYSTPTAPTRPASFDGSANWPMPDATGVYSSLPGSVPVPPQNVTPPPVQPSWPAPFPPPVVPTMPTPPAPVRRAPDDRMPWESEPSATNGAGSSPPVSSVPVPPPSPESVAPAASAPPVPASVPTAPPPGAPAAAVALDAETLEASLKEDQAQEQTAEAPRNPGLLDPAAIALSDLLVGLVEYRDPFFRGNTSLTRLLATAISRDLGLPDDEVNAIALGAVLRDLGQFPLRSVLNRPGLELPPGARKNMERHVDTALDMLTGIQLPRATRDTIRYHHERWDGAGYPDGLKGDAIPLGARIVAVADSFSAMISARPHRLPKRVPAAIEELRAGAGTHYDARVLDALLHVVNATHWRGPGFSLRHHVLIVDSDEARAMVIATRLCSHGYLAEATFNVAAAQERLEHAHIVALIISSDLPGEEEASLLRQVRETARIAMIPVIMTDTGMSERVPLLESGADVCLNRGASFEELKATLEAFLRREGKTIPQGGAKSSDAGWSRLRGDIHDFPLSWLMQVLHYDSRTAAIFIVSERDEGVIYLDRGTPRHAQTRFLNGEEAFRNMLTWKSGTFSVDPDARTDNHTIRLSLMNLLLETAVVEDHASFFGQVQT